MSGERGNYEDPENAENGAMGDGDDYEEIEEEIQETEEQEENVETEDSAAAEAAEGNSELNTTSLEELHVDEASIEAAQEAWRTFVGSAASKEAAADAVYGALFDASPALQYLFVSPRAIAAGKFFGGIASFVGSLTDPPALKIAVEGLAFWHLPIDATATRVIIFRDALLDLFQIELGSKFTPVAFAAFRALFNYVGGSYIFIKKFYAARINLLNESWTLANKGKDKDQEDAEEHDDKSDKIHEAHTEGGQGANRSESLIQNVPTTFTDMFQFNAAVMGFGASVWMNDVLATIHNIVTNVSNPLRLEEECDFLVCRISKSSTGKVNLAEFKSGMLASLRSLLPKDWTTQHEVAWSWMWDLVEKNVTKNMGRPAKWERAYAKFLDGIDEDTGFRLRRDIYARFFSLAPAGQEYFKQSNTYLHLVSTKVLTMAIDIFRDPVRMIDEISGVGLRHVGYGVSPDFFSPFASSTVEVVAGFTSDEECIEGFKWSIGLMAKSTMRTLIEGSTIVMKSININTRKSMKQAISNAPRGERFKWMLLIQVGSQNISPLAWAIQSGALEASAAMIEDLVTFRADREKYYYGAEELFTRHPKIVMTLLRDAPSIVPGLLDGLVWRSRIASDGMRRTNYYLKHLLVDPDGKFSKTLDWITRVNDPKLVCHPVLAILSDLVWTRVAMVAFIIRKSWFVFTLIVFVLGQAVFPWVEEDDVIRCLIFAFRCIIYVLSLGNLLVGHTRKSWLAYRKGNTIKLGRFVSIPDYLSNWQEPAQLLLALLLVTMLCTEPILYCLQSDSTGLFLYDCPEVGGVKKVNSEISMFAMLIYSVLLIDLGVFNNSVSAYLLTCARMTSELALFVFALAVILICFACGLSCVEQHLYEFHGPVNASLAFLELFNGIFNSERYVNDIKEELIVICFVFLFIIVAQCFLLNLFIAQLTCAYRSVYADMVGYARIKRIQVIMETMPGVSPQRFEKFVGSLALNKRIEFNEGDMGVAGGVAMSEPAKDHPTTVDIIKRFGGSTSPDMQWPEDSTAGDDESEKFERLELLIRRAMERMTVIEAGGDKESSAGKATGHVHSDATGGAGDEAELAEDEEEHSEDQHK
eukprot:TRINITY_DN2598_c0_g1_i1.p1 TRINITY_DN2598_c0_g1~~TRINITY_DN2598_c0_g1_i1.p1  ORF type:complete len:1095 (-),score=162.84 TRINITY_DN2598_c0_g1_i1:273-3557(-)